MPDDKILAHARQSAPAESCGYVVKSGADAFYLTCENISAEPTLYFRMAAEDYIRASLMGDVVALVHSHPGGTPYLSRGDRTLQLQTALPWWLVCDGRIYKFRCVPHLTGRQFEHGVMDCGTLIRDAYHLAGIELTDYPREDDWWRRGDDHYLNNMEREGFYRISLDKVQPGDMLLCCFASSIANHAAIYCGNGEFLHHVPGQLSRREVYTDKWQRRTHSAWRHRQWRGSAFTGIYNDLESALISA